jgi:catalase
MRNRRRAVIKVGSNHAQIPVNQPKSQVNNYSQDGAVRYHFNAPTVPVYAPNTLGGPPRWSRRTRPAAGRTTAS